MRPAHLLDIDDLSNQDIEHILATAEEFRGGILPKRLAAEHVMGMHFQEPSVRTRFGFMAAISRLGGAAIDMPAPYQEPQMSSRETLGDVVRSVGGYVHLIVARCATVEALSEIADHSPVPVINAGAGGTQHPTQALIDVFAMHQRFGGVDGLRIGLMGDLSCSRSARSLLRLLARYEPKELRLLHPGGPLTPETLGVSASGTYWRDVGPEADIAGLDVIYMAGFPAGGGPLANDPERREIRARLSLNRSNVSGLSAKALILCPMPRIDEISRELDDAPEMGMFQQSMDGLYVRMALLCFCLRTAIS